MCDVSSAFYLLIESVSTPSVYWMICAVVSKADGKKEPIQIKLMRYKLEDAYEDCKKIYVKLKESTAKETLK